MSDLFCQRQFVLRALEKVAVVPESVGKLLAWYHTGTMLNRRWFHFLHVLNVVDGHGWVPDRLRLLFRQVVLVGVSSLEIFVG